MPASACRSRSWRRRRSRPGCCSPDARRRLAPACPRPGPGPRAADRPAAGPRLPPGRDDRDPGPEPRQHDLGLALGGRPPRGLGRRPRARLASLLRLRPGPPRSRPCPRRQLRVARPPRRRGLPAARPAPRRPARPLLRRDLPRDGHPLHADRPALPGAGRGRHPFRHPARLRQLPRPTRGLPPRRAGAPPQRDARRARHRAPPRPRHLSVVPHRGRHPARRGLLAEPGLPDRRRLCRGDDRRHPGLRRPLLRRPHRRRRARGRRGRDLRRPPRLSRLFQLVGRRVDRAAVAPARQSGRA